MGNRLREMRQERGLSLDRLAQLTGVSKPMLGQIERGISSPTIATLWKIAKGFNVPFTSFLEDEAPLQLVRAADQTAFYEDEERYQVFSTYRAPGSPVELFRMILQPGCKRVAEPHTSGVMESVTVFEGVLRITVSGGTYELQPGDALNFAADIPHTYENPGQTTAVAHLTMFYTTVGARTL
ncbi:helix-turn-helix domain-containing protein [Alicyclobacillus cycloheptanicus]|uniref:helix-turn-helix domain-containing protein n=1 Tax=Alicyclobacillus cycloheptanicus TaxID=1457 RepID=UPI0039670751